jgi:hypothetical protein
MTLENLTICDKSDKLIIEDSPDSFNSMDIDNSDNIIDRPVKPDLSDNIIDRPVKPDLSDNIPIDNTNKHDIYNPNNNNFCCLCIKEEYIKTINICDMDLYILYCLINDNLRGCLLNLDYINKKYIFNVSDNILYFNNYIVYTEYNFNNILYLELFNGMVLGLSVKDNTFIISQIKGNDEILYFDDSFLVGNYIDIIDKLYYIISIIN